MNTKKIRIIASDIVLADKTWSKEEWQKYKKDHPKTKIQPKFKSETPQQKSQPQELKKETPEHSESNKKNIDEAVNAFAKGSAINRWQSDFANANIVSEMMQKAIPKTLEDSNHDSKKVSEIIKNNSDLQYAFGKSGAYPSLMSKGFKDKKHVTDFVKSIIKSGRPSNILISDDWTKHYDYLSEWSGEALDPHRWEKRNITPDTEVWVKWGDVSYAPSL